MSVSFEIDLGDSWSPLDSATSALILEAQLRGQRTVECKARGQQYIIDVRSMVQTNKATGRSRRIRPSVASNSNRPGTGGDEDEIMAISDALPPLRGTAEVTSIAAIRIPDVPMTVTELTQLNESELSRLAGDMSALDAFILQLPRAKSIAERAQTMRDENKLLVNAVGGKLSVQAQQHDAEGERQLERALDAPGAMDSMALAQFRERYIQQKMQKQRVLLSKRRLQCSTLEWHTLCTTPAAGSRS